MTFGVSCTLPFGLRKFGVTIATYGNCNTDDNACRVALALKCDLSYIVATCAVKYIHTVACHAARWFDRSSRVERVSNRGCAEFPTWKRIVFVVLCCCASGGIFVMYELLVVFCRRGRYAALFVLVRLALYRSCHAQRYAR